MRKYASYLLYSWMCLALLAGCSTTARPSAPASCIPPEFLQDGRCSSPPPPPPAPAAPAPAPALPPAPAPAPAPEKISFSADALFSAGQSTLRPAAKATLDDLVSKLKDIDLEVVVVIGHTDSSGSASYSQSLSVSRAATAKAYLVSRGVPESKIYVTGKGKLQPIASNDTPEGRAKNNRIEVGVVGTHGDIDTAWVPNNLVPVLFATNRKRTGSDNPFYYYGNQISDLNSADRVRHGVTVVRIPPARQRGEIKRPGWVKVTLQRIGDKSLATALHQRVPDLIDLKTEFSFQQKIEELSSDEFKARLQAAVKGAKQKTAVLYVHGYANDFVDAAFRTAQMAYDIADEDFEIVPIMFSWPSDPGVLGMAYNEAHNRVKRSAEDLEGVLREIALRPEVGTIQIVAHSMGAQVLVEALKRLKTENLVWPGPGLPMPKFRQIVFAAADVTPELFKEIIEPAIKTRHTVTSYVSSKDVALWASTKKNRVPVRVGNSLRAETLVPCVDTIDVTNVDTRGLAHSTWAETPRVLDDLRLLLQFKAEPRMRGLIQRIETKRTLWKVPRTAPELQQLGEARLALCDAAN